MSEAPAVHRRLFKIDTHCDTPTARLMNPGWDFSARHDFGVDGSQCDLPRMKENIDALFFATFCPQGTRTPAGFAASSERATQVIARTREIVGQNAARCGLALSAADALRLKSENRHAIFLSIENGYCLGRDPGNIAEYHGFGMRMLGLTHMLNNDLADSSTDPRGPEWGGLSPLGRDIVSECNRLGVVLDASHASDDALRDLLEQSKSPVILSHSGCRAICDHPRNVDDDLLRALATNGGVIQINAWPPALVSAPDRGRAAAVAAQLLRLQDLVPTPRALAETGLGWLRIEREFPNPVASLDDVVRQIEHAVAVAGIDHVGLGCDFDGGGGVTGLGDVGEYPALTAALLARGWSETMLAKLWGENTLRVVG